VPAWSKNRKIMDDISGNSERRGLLHPNVNLYKKIFHENHKQEKDDKSKEKWTKCVNRVYLRGRVT
jgi:hypothetical protein